MIYVERQFTASEWFWRLTNDNDTTTIANGTGSSYNQALNNAMVAYRTSESE